MRKNLVLKNAKQNIFKSVLFIVSAAILVACGGDKTPANEATNTQAGKVVDKKIGREYIMQLAPGMELAAEQVFHKGNGAEVQTLDPHKAEGVPSSNVLRDLYEGLTSEAHNSV